MPTLRGGIWVPSASYTKEAMAVDKAVRDYDERLSFGFNEENQDWVIFIDMPHGSERPRQPILGFGNEVPSPDEAIKRLWKTDAVRHGDWILEQIRLENEKITKANEAVKDAALEEAAEKIEFANRRHGLRDQDRFFVDKKYKGRPKVEFRGDG